MRDKLIEEWSDERRMDGILFLYIKLLMRRNQCNCRRDKLVLLLLCSLLGFFKDNINNHLIMASEMALLWITSERLLIWLCGLAQCEFWQLVARWVKSGPSSPKLGLKTGRHESRHTRTSTRKSKREFRSEKFTLQVSGQILLHHLKRETSAL